MRIPIHNRKFGNEIIFYLTFIFLFVPKQKKFFNISLNILAYHQFYSSFYLSVLTTTYKDYAQKIGILSDWRTIDRYLYVTSSVSSLQGQNVGLLTTLWLPILLRKKPVLISAQFQHVVRASAFQVSMPGRQKGIQRACALTSLGARATRVGCR